MLLISALKVGMDIVELITNEIITISLYLMIGKDQRPIQRSLDRLGMKKYPKTLKRMPLRSNHEAVIITGAGFSVVVTVTVTVTVAWPFPTAAFSFIGTPIGANVVLAPSALDIDVLVTLSSVGWRPSGLTSGDVVEDCVIGVEISG